jgi:chromosome segregation ATPase
MGKLPEDLQLALEGLRLLNEKFIVPLSRLESILRVSAESHVQIAEANKRLERVQGEIAEAQRKALQQEERSQTRLKALGEQLGTLQGKWAQEEQAHKERVDALQETLGQLDGACAARHRERDALAKEMQEETKRLEELRERIRRAQTMEP